MVLQTPPPTQNNILIEVLPRPILKNGPTVGLNNFLSEVTEVSKIRSGRKTHALMAFTIDGRTGIVLEYKTRC